MKDAFTAAAAGGWNDTGVGHYDRFVEHLLGFLLLRVDEAGLARLIAHEPTRMSAAYFEGGGGRAETRVARFTGCATCSRFPSDRYFASYRHIDVEEWPCQEVRLLAGTFADDPDYRAEWRPEYAVFASGQPVQPGPAGTRG